MEGLEAHLLEELREFLLGSDFVEVQVVGVLLQDALTHRLLLDLPQTLSVLADYT
jgi:hypothetical protein